MSVVVATASLLSQGSLIPITDKKLFSDEIRRDMRRLKERAESSDSSPAERVLFKLLRWEIGPYVSLYTPGSHSFETHERFEALSEEEKQAALQIMKGQMEPPLFPSFRKNIRWKVAVVLAFVGDKEAYEMIVSGLDSGDRSIKSLCVWKLLGLCEHAVFGQDSAAKIRELMLSGATSQRLLLSLVFHFATEEKDTELLKEFVRVRNARGQAEDKATRYAAAWVDLLEGREAYPIEIIREGEPDVGYEVGEPIKMPPTYEFERKGRKRGFRALESAGGIRPEALRWMMDHPSGSDHLAAIGWLCSEKAERWAQRIQAIAGSEESGVDEARLEAHKYLVERLAAGGEEDRKAAAVGLMLAGTQGAGDALLEALARERSADVREIIESCLEKMGCVKEDGGWRPRHD